MSLAQRGSAVPKEVRDALARDRRQKAYRLSVKGLTPRQIAEHLTGELGIEITRGQIVKDLALALDENAKDLNRLIGREIVLQLGRLEDLYANAMSEFERSKLDMMGVTTREYNPKKKGKPKGGEEEKEPDKRTLTETHVEGRLGDPRYLSEARQILSQRLRLLGLDQPEAIKVVIEQFNQTNVKVESQQVILSPEQATELATLYRQFGIGADGTPLPLDEPAGLLPEPESEIAIDAEYANPEAERVPGD